MPKLKPGYIWATPADDAAIMAGIAVDPDNPELDAEWFATAKTFQEVYPNGRNHPPRPPHELWPDRFPKPEPESEQEESKMSTVGIDHIAMPAADAEGAE